MPDNKLDKLYATITKVGLTDKDQDTFIKEYASDPDKQNKLYQTLSKVGLTDKDQDTFRSEYFGTPAPVESKGVNAESQDGGFQFLSANTNSSLESEEITPVVEPLAVSDESLDLYDQYRTIIGGTTTTEQESEISATLEQLKGNLEDPRKRSRNKMTDSDIEKSLEKRRKELTESYRDVNRREFLGSLSDEERTELDNIISTNYNSLKESNKIKIAENEVKTSYLKKIEAEVAQYQGMTGDELTAEDKENLKELAGKYTDIYSGYISNLNEISEDTEDLGTFEQEKAMLMRTTSQMENLSHKAFGSTFRALSNITNFVGDLPMGGATADIPLKSQFGISPDEDVFPVFREIADGYESIEKPNINFDAIQSPADLFTWGIETAVDQVGVLMASATGNPYFTFLTVGANSGGAKKDELKKSNASGETNYSDEDIRAASLFSFVVEGGTGLVTGSSINAAKRTFKASVGSLKEGTVDLTKKALLKQAAKGAGTEMVEETTAQLMDNIFHMSYLEDKDRHIFDGLAEAATGALFTSGTISSVGTGAPLLISETTKAVRNNQQRKDFKANNNRIKELVDEHNALEEGDPLKKNLKSKINSLQKSNDNIIKENIDVLNKLTPENAAAISKIDKKTKDLLAEKKSIEVSENLSEDTKKELIEDVSTKIINEVKNKEFVLANSGDNISLRKKAQKAALALKVQEAKEKGLEDKPTVSKKDIDKQYDRLLAEMAKADYDQTLAKQEGAINPAIENAELYLADPTKDTKEIREGFEANYKDTDYYKGLDEDSKKRVDISMADTFRILSDNAGRKPEGDSLIKNVKGWINEKKKSIEKNFIDEFAEIDRQLNSFHGEGSRDFKEKRKLHKNKIRRKISDYGDRVSDFAKQVDDSTLDLPLFDKLLKAQHALEADKHVATQKGAVAGVSGGISIPLAKKILEGITPEQKADFDKFSGDFKKFVEENRNELRRTGRIDEETFNSYQDYYDNYISLKGFANPDIDIDNTTGSSSKLSSKAQDNKRRKGKAVESENAIANLLDAYVSTIEQGEKDIVIQALANTYDSDSDLNLFEVYDSISDAPMEIREDQNARVTFNEDGKRKYLVFHNKEFNRIFNNADKRKETNLILKILIPYTKAMKGLITTFNPEFLVSNAARDTQVAFRSISRELELSPELKGVDAKKVRGYMRGNLATAIKNLPSILKGKDIKDPKLDQYGKEFMEHGGSSGISQASIETIKKRAKVSLKNSSKGSKFVTKVKGLGNSILNTVEVGNSVVENMHRFNAFSALREQGINPQTAARVAKDLTIDFDQSGTHGSTASTVYYFFNAAIQGNKVAYKNLFNLRRDKDGKVTGLTRSQKSLLLLPTYTFLSTVAAIAYSEEDEDGKTHWEKDPEYLKRNSLRIYLGDEDGMTGTIPLSYGSNVVAYTGTLAAEYMMGTISGKDAISNFTEALVDVTSPIAPANSDENSLIKTVTPSVLQTPVNLALNENFFGSPIYNDSRFSDKADASKGRKNTPVWYKATAKYLNEISGGNMYRSGEFDVHPETLEYVVESSLGGLGKFVSNTANTVGAITTDDREVEVNKIPFVRRFLHEPSQLASVYEFKDKHDFIINQDKALYEDYTKAKESGDKEKADALYKEGVKVGKVFTEYKAAQKRLKEIQKMKNQLEGSTLDEEKIKKGLKHYEDLTIKITKKLNGYYNKVLGKSYK